MSAFVMIGWKLNMSRLGARKTDKSYWHRVTWEFVGLMIGIFLGASFSQVEPLEFRGPALDAADIATAERRVVFVPAGSLAGFCLGGICAWLWIERSRRFAVVYFLVYVCLVCILTLALNM